VAATSFAQSGGGGNPKFEQPREQPRETPRSTEGRYDLRPKYERGQSIKLKLEVNNLMEQPAVNVDVLEAPETTPAKKPARKSSTSTKTEIEKTKSKVEFGIVMKVKE